MNSKIYNPIKNLDILNFLLLKNKLNGIFNDHKNINLSGMTNDISTIDTDLSLKNHKFNINEENIFYKNPDKFLNEIFKVYSEDGCLCNYLLFEKNIDIKMDLVKEIKKITLKDYFDTFNKASFLSLNIPYIGKNGKVYQNVFNPTLSSMLLIIKSKKSIDENMYKKYIKKDFSIYSLPNNMVKIEFDETNPPYYRDTLYSKIKIIHKIISKKRIPLNDVLKDKSYFSILWSQVDAFKCNSSFLAFYTFDFKLIGSLIIKRDDNLWLKSFNNRNYNYKDFKKYYLNKVNIIDNFIKNKYQDKRKIISNDYKQYINNSNEFKRNDY